jgi:hypothetical protein
MTEDNAITLFTARLELETATRKRQSDQEARDTVDKMNHTIEAIARNVLTPRLELKVLALYS